MKAFNRYIELLKKYFTVIISCFLIGYVIYYSSSVILIKVVEQSLKELASQGAYIVKNELENHLYLLKTIAKSASINNPNYGSFGLNESLKRFRGGSKNLELYLFDTEGFIISDAENIQNIKEHKFFQKALLGASSYSQPIASFVDGSRIVAFATPILYNNQVKYVLISTYQIEELCSIIENISFFDNGDAFMIDSSGYMIAHNNRSLVEARFNVLQAVKTEPELQRLAELGGHMIRGESGAGQYYFNGIEKYMAYAPVGDTTWTIAVTAPRQEVIGGVSRILNLILILLISSCIMIVAINAYFYYLKRRANKLQAISRTAIDVASIVIIKIDYNGQIKEINEHAQMKLGYKQETINKINIFDLLDEKNAGKLDSVMINLQNGVVEKDFELSIKALCGETKYFLLNINQTPDEIITNEIELMGTDLTEHIRSQELLQAKHEELSAVYEQLAASEEELKEQLDEVIEHQQKLRESEQRYALVVEASSIGIWDVDLTNNDLYLSKRCKEIINFQDITPLRAYKKWKKHVHSNDREDAASALSDYLNRRIPALDIEYRVINEKAGYKWVRSVCKALWDGNGNILRLAGAHTDITQKKTYEDKITKLAYFDSLTGLYNKASAIDRFYHMINSGMNKIALFFMDLDNFKLTNDTYGHAVGDMLLIQVAETLNKIKRPTDFISRFGGDEFLILTENFKNYDELEEFADALVKSMDSIFKVNSYSINVSSSIGIAVYPLNAGDFDGLLKNADTAMYKAKENGKNRYEFYNSSMNKAIYEKLFMQSYIKKALSEDEFFLNYQPLFTTNDQKLIGFEALLRWASPEMGDIAPGRFIPVAEETRLILPIGDWVIATACGFLKEMHEVGHPELIMSVNISIYQLQQQDFAKRILEILKQNNLKPESLELEITESVLIQYIDEVADNISLLKKMGIKITLDDFGTGYSSLNYLTQLPINTLKIDKSFIERIGKTDENKLIIEPIIFISKKMGLATVAEGVETTQQLEYLRGIGCDAIQGYLLGRPQSGKSAIDLVKKQPKGNG